MPKRVFKGSNHRGPENVRNLSKKDNSWRNVAILDKVSAIAGPCDSCNGHALDRVAKQKQ